MIESEGLIIPKSVEYRNHAVAEKTVSVQQPQLNSGHLRDRVPLADGWITHLDLYRGDRTGLSELLATLKIVRLGRIGRVQALEDKSRTVSRVASVTGTDGGFRRCTENHVSTTKTNHSHGCEIGSIRPVVGNSAPLEEAIPKCPWKHDKRCWENRQLRDMRDLEERVGSMGGIEYWKERISRRIEIPPIDTTHDNLRAHTMWSSGQ